MFYVKYFLYVEWLVQTNIIISFDAMAKQTPYRYSADAKDIIGNVYDFCKREKEGGLKISSNQAKEWASTATGVSKRTIELVKLLYENLRL